MAEQILFDRLAYMDRLKRAGIAEEHARAHAEAMDEALRESVATKPDLALVRQDIEALRVATKGDIEALRAATRGDLDLLRRDTIITIGTASTALFAALVAIKFFA